MSSIFDYAERTLHAVPAKLYEAELQLNGYRHFLAVGRAQGAPERSRGILSRTFANMSETASTLYGNFGPSASASGISASSVRALTDPQKETTWQYLMVHQLLAGYLPDNIRQLKNVVTSLGKPIDDRRLQLEDVVSFLATAGKQNDHDPASFLTTAQGQFINLLWEDLPHPPAASLDPKLRFRTPDDSYNNPAVPLLGAAGEPYARSVPPKHPLPPSLPSEGEVFDALLRRPKDTFDPHPAGISSLLFAFATVIIHDCFWTDSSDPTVNLCSSYLSLSPLYGRNEEEQLSVRNQTEGSLGRGLLHEDVYASTRILMMPPAAAALLVLFSRNHNRIARNILQLNERGDWSPDLGKLAGDKEKLKKQDDEIFGTAQHVNCAWFVNIILGDYLQTILGTVQADSDWKLDPRMEVKSLLGKTPSGGGNAVSIEFNALYRWHAPISNKDTKWLELKMAAARPGTAPADVDWDSYKPIDLLKAQASLRAELGALSNPQDPQSAPAPPTQWKLAKYETVDDGTGKVTYVDGTYGRGADGKFANEHLAKLLKDATNEIAGSYGAKRNPAVFKIIDVLGMSTARSSWRACTLNEFRRFLGLKAFSTFEEWNEDPEIAKAAEDIYGYPENIELYPGLMAEQTKKPRLGAGLCGNYTLTRAIMSDATSLVRGDRFYTSCASVHELTQWGLQDCQADPKSGAYGGLLHRLIEENLPGEYAFNDVALLFPFAVPEQMMATLRGIPGKAQDYRVNVPKPIPEGIYRREEDGKTYLYEYPRDARVESARMQELVGMHCGKYRGRSNIRDVFEALQKAITPHEYERFGMFLEHRIIEASVRRNETRNRLTVNITRDVTTPVIVGFLAHIFGITQTNLHSRQHLMCALSDLYWYLHETPQASFKSREAARLASAELFDQLVLRINAENPTKSLLGAVRQTASNVMLGGLNVLDSAISIVNRQQTSTPTYPVASAFYAEIARVNQAREFPHSAEELASDCLQALGLLTFALANSAAAAIDYVLSDADALATTVRLANKSLSVEKNVNRLERLAAESVRVNHWDPNLKGLVVEERYMEKAADTPLGYIDLTFVPDRPSVAYHRLTDIDGLCFPMFLKTMPIILHRVFGKDLPQIKRAEGMQGELRRIVITSSVATVPTLTVQYGDGSPVQPHAGSSGGRCPFGNASSGTSAGAAANGVRY